MNNELEQLSEVIIKAHKEKNGTIVWTKETFNRRDTTPAKEYLIDLGLIKKTELNTTVLTIKGWEFESFEVERQKPNPEFEKLNLEIINLRNQVFDYGKVRAQAKWALIISAMAALAVIVALFK